MTAKLDVHAEVPPRPAKTKKTRWETQNERAQITFDKTIDGHYRHGKTGYTRVACLFLTWLDDDLQCKATEVDALREIFATSFHFETDYYEIPSKKWQTALQRKVANFVYEYDSPDCMVIIYYGGHGYVGLETGQLKWSAKEEPDADGDPTVFFNDVISCLRLPACDQLLIVDCCFAAKAFVRHHIGKRKFELLTSAGVQDMVPGPSHQGSFTKSLNDVLKSLLISDPRGFSTSRLFRELYHVFAAELDKSPRPKTEKPVRPSLFDQARQDLGRIWLRPQKETHANPKPGKGEDSVHLKLSLQLNEQPNNVLMNELALALQHLPHVDKVEFKDLYAPRRHIENFVQSIIQAQKLRPLIRKIVAKRRLKKFMETKQGPAARQQPSMQRMLLEQKHHSIYDWSSAVKDDGWGSRAHDHHRRKSSTWPVGKPEHAVTTGSFYNRLFSIDLAVDIPGKSLMSRLFSWGADTDAGSTHHSNSTTVHGPLPFTPTINPTALIPARVVTSPSNRQTWRKYLYGEETWYMLMVIAILFELGSFCLVMRD